MAKTSSDRLTVGWREWVGLPDLGVRAIKAKIDTGARTSALHVTGVHRIERDGDPWVRFAVHPVQRSEQPAVVAEAPLVEHRPVRSSSGHLEHRLVIATTLLVGEAAWPIELTLTRRDAMGFRMLIGRQAVRRRALIDPGRSYLTRDRPSRRSLLAGGAVTGSGGEQAFVAE